MKPHVIRASAGTGKTYRLSLEFINLMLKYRIDFEEIVVITFTKKATAEIRERIFTQLKNITCGNEEGKQIISNFRKTINNDIKFTEDELTFLNKIYQKMLINKSSVHISTIDSFINTIFSGIIAPYHNISDFKIDNNINSEILPEIYDHILTGNRIGIFSDIFIQTKRRNLKSFERFILEVIEKRWLFEFIDLSDFDENTINTEKDRSWLKFETELRNFLQLLQDEILQKGEAPSKLFNKDFKKSLASVTKKLDSSPQDVSTILFDLLSSSEYIENHSNIILSDRNIWNGQKIRNKELKVLHSHLREAFAEYIYWDKALTEQFNLISLASNIFEIYDKIKFRDKVFTHTDISYYTFKFLYDENLSIIDQGNILNLFYEQLSYNTRFVLIDEFQDTSILQWYILKPMLKEIISGMGQKDYGNVIVVGDEKQAIYGWRGGERRLLQEFDKLINSEIKQSPLKTSYRSKPQMVDFINKIFNKENFNHLPDWQYENINSDFDEGGFVQVYFRNRYKVETIQDTLSRSQIYQEFIDKVLKVQMEKEVIHPADTAILMRKNDELESMAELLDENQIEYTLESSGSLFEYHAVKPIIFILNFLAYDDILELIKFLRSDLILMHPKELEEIIDKYNDRDNMISFLNSSDLLKKLLIVIDQTSIRAMIKTILEEFGFTHIFSSEIELKNIFRFLEVSSEFEKDIHEYNKNVPGFLKYCRALIEKDNYSQIGQSISKSIKLLTIHKAKGLQFETVYTVIDVSVRSGGINSGLKFYYHFNENFTNLQDFSLTYNYDRILKLSSKKDLINSVHLREKGDELNNFYVALTRAKNNLIIYQHYKKKGGLESLVDNIDMDSSINKCLAKTIYQVCSEDLVADSQILQTFECGKPRTNYNKKSKKKQIDYSLKGYLELHDLSRIEKEEFPDIFQLKKEMLDNKSILIGNIAHEYLSHIKYAKPEELDAAHHKIIAKFGGLMKLEMMENIINQVDKFIKDNIHLFEKRSWNRVLNEFTIFDDKENEYRIDRMMINTDDKKILIIDYKTGSFFEKKQLSRYKKIIRELPFAKKQNYKVESKFVIVNIDANLTTV